MKGFVVVLSAGVLALSACTSQQALEPGSHLTAVQGGILPPPTAQDLAIGGRSYTIGPLDKLDVSVFNVPELAVKGQVDAAGILSFPLIGSIQAAGKTPGELARTLEQGLRAHYVRNPQVTVNIEDTVSQVVSVSGEVREPGLYPVVGEMTLIRAVATAKGVSDFAKLRDVVVFRTVGQRKMAAIYNLDAIQRGTYEDPEIFANDVVVVGNSASRRMFKDVLTLVPALAPLIYVLR